jgi:hypothetical protein
MAVDPYNDQMNQSMRNATARTRMQVPNAPPKLDLGEQPNIMPMRQPQSPPQQGFQPPPGLSQYQPPAQQPAPPQPQGPPPAPPGQPMPQMPGQMGAMPQVLRVLRLPRATRSSPQAWLLGRKTTPTSRSRIGPGRCTRPA